MEETKAKYPIGQQNFKSADLSVRTITNPVPLKGAHYNRNKLA